MGYGTAAVENLTQWLGTIVPEGGGTLELGQQQINPEVPANVVHKFLETTTGNSVLAADLYREYFVDGNRRIADGFQGSRFAYRCIDLVEADMVIYADLNRWNVPEELRGKFDLVTNMGTSEHVFNQENVFRVVHDLCRPNGTMFHSVPAIGYLNHGLINYHPAFFVLLAEANEYEIALLRITQPFAPYTIPPTVPGWENWRSEKMHCGNLSALLRKQRSNEFRLFTDYDVNLLGNRELSEPWASMMFDRYELKVHR